MINTSRLGRIFHARIAPGRDISGTPVMSWEETLELLVRSHRARLSAPDPSRPWLAHQASPPTSAGWLPGDDTSRGQARLGARRAATRCARPGPRRYADAARRDGGV